MLWHDRLRSSRRPRGRTVREPRAVDHGVWHGRARARLERHLRRAVRGGAGIIHRRVPPWLPRTGHDRRVTPKQHQRRLKHARHSAVGGRTRGDSDRTGGRRRVRGARSGARTADLERGPSKRWPTRVSRGHGRVAGGANVLSHEVDALRGESRPRSRPLCHDTSALARLTVDDRHRTRTSRWARRAHGVSRDDLLGDLRTRYPRSRVGVGRACEPVRYRRWRGLSGRSTWLAGDSLEQFDTYRTVEESDVTHEVAMVGHVAIRRVAEYVTEVLDLRQSEVDVRDRKDGG